MRVRNLRGLRPDRHPVRAPGRRGRRGGTARPVVPEDETKNGEPPEFPLPPALPRLLDLHLGRHRRHLPRGEDEGWLFPGEKGGPEHAVGLAGRIERAVRRQAGLEVRAGSVYPNGFSGSIGGASAGFKPPRSAAAG